MNTKLHYIENWLELAQRANWSVANVAELCVVSIKTLERYFIREKGKTPKAWLAEQRQYQALELLRNGFSVKETAMQMGYSHATQFSREFHKFWGSSPGSSLTAHLYFGGRMS